MIHLARALARLVALLLLIALATTGLAVAVFSIEGGRSGLSLPALARHLHLPELRGTVGRFLAQLERGGGIDLVPLLAGLGAVILGVVLMIGVLRSPRDRTVVLDEDDDAGSTAARRRPLAELAGVLAGQADGVTGARVKVRPGRHGGGRLAVRVSHPPARAGAEVKAAATDALSTLTEETPLSARVSARRAGPGERGR